MATELQSRLSPSPIEAPHRPRGAAVRARGVTRRFGDRTVIDDLDLDIHPGEFVALLGASGCGKSTLLRILAGLDQEMSGDVLVSARRGVGFQAPRLLPWKRVAENVGLGYKGADGLSRIAATLAEVGLSHRARAWPKELSGGEAQRASLARALMRDPDLLLLDEPFSALDALTRMKAQALVGQLWSARGCAVLLVTHDVEEAMLLADRILVMREGRIEEEVSLPSPRPRSLDDGGFVQNRAEILGMLGL
ncbi:ABC transporter ATP-binding protein [Novosphingobium terrae]|uniref:ABC transporter ATP-binding protein n=1 Tax=Novosphingobium terrae TaxID=2726189 RepID=UPI00197D27EC|nr:ABC transporter ATP-binding protein [Novosphingobium terrae]